MHFNITLPSIPGPSWWFLSFGFLTRISKHYSTRLARAIFPDFIVLLTFVDDYKYEFSPSLCFFFSLLDSNNLLKTVLNYLRISSAKVTVAINHFFVSDNSEYETNAQYVYTWILLQISLNKFRLPTQKWPHIQTAESQFKIHINHHNTSSDMST